MKIITVPREAMIVIVEDDLRRRNFYLSRHRMPDAYLCHDPADAVELFLTSQNPFGHAVLDRILPRAIVAPFGTLEIVRN